MNSTNKQRDNRNGVWGESPNGGERMLGEKQQQCVWINHLTHVMKGNFRGKDGGVKLRILLITERFFFLLFGFSPLVFFLLSSKMQKEEKLFCSPGWLSLDGAVSQGLLGLGKCQIAKLSFTGQLAKNRDGTLNCSFYFLSKSLTIKTTSCRDLRSLPFFF